MAIDTLQTEPTLATSWDEAYAKFRKLGDAFDEAIDRHADAELAASNDCPREAKFFDVYSLGMGMSRQRVIETLAWHNGIAGEKAETIADEFEVFQARSREANERHNIAELDKRIAEIREPWRAARDELMAVPAPDASALLVKLEQAFMSQCNEHEESAMADARRLLA